MRTGFSAPGSLLVPFLLVLALAWPAAAAADVSRPYETAAQAYGPLQFGHTYAGAFASGDDLDYLAFTVPKPETLQVTVQNTTGACNDPNGAGCPVYATLMDAAGTSQLGGDSSGAGTIATAGDTESFTWSFAPGTYNVLMESNGGLPAGSPSYAVTLSSPTGGSGGPTPVAPVLSSLSVPPRQHGRRVVSRIVLGQPVTRLRADLGIKLHGRTVTISSRTLSGLRAGSHRITLPLSAAYIRHLARVHRLSLFVRLTLRAVTGSRLVYTRAVSLTR